MAAFSSSPLLYMSKNPISLNFPSPIVFFLPCYHHAPSPHLHFRALCALKTGSDGGSVGSRDAYNSEILRKPVMSSVDDDVGSAKAAISNSDFGEPAEEGKKGYKEEDEWVDWEDRILQDTVPLVGFVRMILHSGRDKSFDMLAPEHEGIINPLLPHFPLREKRINCAINKITIGYHPEFESSRCLFIVRKDGEMVDFSFWKCIKGLIRKNYPLYAENFILRHFRRRKSKE
ncbi:protein DCL homolog, chloroplastic isoform X3 [Macadamia integrifolia]|uniref:protein DCL homolog, chloroplastic isoform X3 n=1 Tax=Macadamia integrifolia TaxID=60698 RepID=UPI001C4E8D49|nr:protein DCL homolog, chloroplastic isoform X3 [Macadamia integrifolia]